MKKLLASALKNPRTCIAVLAGLLLCFGAAGVTWRASDRILAAEAERQAIAGQSEAVAATRSDWPVSVGPVALLAAGRPGSEARRVASARIDLAIRRAERGDHRRLLDEGLQLLRAIRAAEGVPTEAGTRWAQWLAERLTATAGRFGAKEKMLLLTETEATLATLAGSAQRPKSATAFVEPSAPATIDVVEPPPRPIAVAPVVEHRFIEPAPLPTAETTELIVRRMPPSDWQPDWQDTGTQSVAEIGPDVLPELPPRIAQPLPAASLADRALLSEFVQLVTTLGPVPMASGPTSVAQDDEAAVEDPVRSRLQQLRSELARRGFRAVTAIQVASLLSPDPADRLTLVNDLLSVPSADAVRLLLLLASDESADVRAAAISGLGSSSSRELVQAAWELATQDDDYRVGRLAEALRQRLR